MAVRDIAEGDEVVWDYGVRSDTWTKCRLLNGVVVVNNRADSPPKMEDKVSTYRLHSYGYVRACSYTCAHIYDTANSR